VNALGLREWGAAAGRPLLYWHGLNPFGALALNEAGPAWAARGFHVVSIDAPGIADGHTLPDLAGYRPSSLAALIVEAAESLGIDRFDFVGWSWGASIGVHLGARHADRLRGLVLLDAGHTDVPGDASTPLDEVVASFGEQHVRYRFDDWDAFLAAAKETRPRWRPALEEQLRAGMREEDGAIVAASDKRAAAAAWHGLLQEQPSSAHEALGRSGLPVLLVVASENDSRDEVERFRAAVPTAEIREVESGHDLLADAPDETIELVAEWLLNLG
jgi:pimeloyl-ACP methyl ester carboxylesterase